jgi:arylsulfatase A
LPTAAELAGVKAPGGLDGQSVAPVLLGTGTVKPHEFLYWEFHEQGSKQAVRTGDWKAIRTKPGGPLELYDLSKDLGEKENIAGGHPDVVAKVEAYLKAARTESKEWPLRAGKK